MREQPALSLADKWEIQELVAKYAYAIDHRQAQALSLIHISEPTRPY